MSDDDVFDPLAEEADEAETAADQEGDEMPKGVPRSGKRKYTKHKHPETGQRPGPADRPGCFEPRCTECPFIEKCKHAEV
ncbi:MAG: hypothetical protein NT016_01685 [Candidatus Aenigmarchaeota archaeon]|nr:hypothetical protein [Candidatus Aenigmarchaeota archaeon]